MMRILGRCGRCTKDDGISLRRIKRQVILPEPVDNVHSTLLYRRQIGEFDRTHRELLLQIINILITVDLGQRIAVATAEPRSFQFLM
jgi:hypothetical protein